MLKANSNLTILEDNIMCQFETQEAKEAFMWAKTVTGTIEAETFALEVDLLLMCSVNIPEMIVLASRQYNNQMTINQAEDLKKFILTRHCHWRFPDTKGDWLR